KSPEQFKLIGKYDRRLDAQQKVDGTSVFGIDVQREGMVHAVLVRCPHFGGTLKSFDASASKQIAGVSDIFALGAAVAIIASGYWPARKAAQALTVEWDKGPLAGLDSAGIRAALKKQLDEGEAHNVTDEGKAPGGDTTGLNTQIIEAEYYAPYQAHAAMEPLNCVADVRTDRVDIWTGNQSPDIFRATVADALQRPRESVFIHTPMLGGGFGRRAFPDYAIEAALLSHRTGRPVKLIWSREDDMRHDYYRPAALSRFRAYLQDGKLVGWENKVTGPSIMQAMIPMAVNTMVGWIPERPLQALGNLMAIRDSLSTEGAAKLAYATPYLKVDYTLFNPGIPIGSWRSVGHSFNGYFVESFFDEIAHALKQDPLAFRLAQLKPEATRARAVLELAAAKAGWGKAPAGRFQGLAVHEAFDTLVAEVAEISIEGSQIKVHKVTCAVECGRVVNPDIVAMQIESGVIYALSAAVNGEITIEDGAVKQGNFNDFAVVRMQDAPAIEVHIVPSDAEPTGVGEPGVPPLAAAVGNAIFAATGKRLRELPFRLA
ncbi:MAG: molybdopterin cofactor-binding domain-containing protein, partial [Spongiibacteraceae bacterium]